MVFPASDRSSLQVGMLMTLLGVVEVLSGIFYSKLSSKFGRLRIYFLVVALETANLLFSLFWPPTGYSWAPYVMAILWGASDGLKNPVFTGGRYLNYYKSIEATILFFFRNCDDVFLR